MLLVSSPAYRYYGGNTNGMVEAFNITNVTDIHTIRDIDAVFSLVNDKPSEYHSHFGWSIAYNQQYNILAISSPAYNYADGTHAWYQMLYHALIAFVNLLFDFTLESNTQQQHSGQVYLINITDLRNDVLLTEINPIATIQHSVTGSRFGYKLLFDDNRLIVTAPMYSIDESTMSECGAVYIYNDITKLHGTIDAVSSADIVLYGHNVNGRFGSSMHIVNEHNQTSLLVSEPRSTITCDINTDNDVCDDNVAEMAGLVYKYKLVDYIEFS